MKRIVALCLLLTACAPLRSGTVCITPFSLPGVTNVALKPELLQNFQHELQRELRRELEEKSVMAVVTTCSSAEYQLQGKFVSLERYRQRYEHGEVAGIYAVEVEGKLTRRGSGEAVVDFSDYQSREGAEETVRKLTKSIVKDIRRDPGGKSRRFLSPYF